MAIPLTAALIMLALGQGLQYNAQRRSAKKTRAAVDTAERRQDEIQDKRRQLVMRNLEQYDPTTRVQEQEKVSAESAKGLQDIVTGAGDTTRIQETGGKVSDAYTTDRARAVTDNMKRAAVMAALMGKARAPSDLRFEEAMKGGEYATRQGELAGIARGRAVTDEAKIRGASQLDPRVMLLGNLLSTAGLYGAAGSIMNPGTAGATAAGTSTPTSIGSEGLNFLDYDVSGHNIFAPKPTPKFPLGPRNL